MVTLFTIPKPFHGHIGTIQRNAIRSWTLLRPRPRIILFGNEEGVADVARECNLQHVPEIVCNEYGTPLLNDVLDKAYIEAGHDTLIYVNADILLMNSFLAAVEVISAMHKKFLIVSKRIDLDVVERMEFQTGWEESIKEKLEKKGSPGPHTAIDVFAFGGEMYRNAPPFAIGRMWFDHWFIRTARLAEIPVIDVSIPASVVHQNHDYAHIRGGREEIFTSEEGRRNLGYYGSGPESFTLLSASHELTKDYRLRRLRFRVPIFRAKQLAWEILIRRTFPLRRRLRLRKQVWSSALNKDLHRSN